MQPLATTRLMMMWLSMCPADESTTVRQKTVYVAHTWAVFMLNLFGFVANMVFIFKNVSIDFDGAMFAIMGAIGQVGLIYVHVVAIQMCRQIGNIFTSLSTIYENYGNDVTFWYLTRVNNTSEWMWTIYKKYITVSLSGVAALSLLSMLFCYLIRGYLSVDHFYRPIKVVLPWNQTTIPGYFGEVNATILIVYAYFIVNGTPLLLFISLCMHHSAFYKMFKLKIDNSEKFDDKLLCDLIRFDISTKEFFSDSANVYSPFVLIQLICSTVMMTVSVFYLDLQWHQFDFNVASVMVSTSTAMFTLLLYCYFGKLATESYEMMSDRVYRMKWYEQPTELQKCFILMIANMQKPVYYRGFYVANLDLRIFIKLCNSIYSCYMLIKSLASK